MPRTDLDFSCGTRSWNSIFLLFSFQWKEKERVSCETTIKLERSSLAEWGSSFWDPFEELNYHVPVWVNGGISDASLVGQSLLSIEYGGGEGIRLRLTPSIKKIKRPCLWDKQIARAFIHLVQLRVPRSSYSFIVWSPKKRVREGGISYYCVINYFGVGRSLLWLIGHNHPIRSGRFQVWFFN